MANQVIDVRINPNEQPEATAVQTNETPINTTPKKTGLTNINPVALGIALNTGRQVFQAATTNIATVTGRSDLQRKVNQGLNSSRILGQIGFGLVKGGALGFGAIAAVGVEMAINVAQQGIEVRNTNIEAEFYRTMRGNRINRSRK